MLIKVLVIDIMKFKGFILESEKYMVFNICVNYYYSEYCKK